MKLKEIYEKPLKEVVREMNLIDVKIYPDKNGEVQAVLLKYINPLYANQGSGICRSLIREEKF